MTGATHEVDSVVQSGNSLAANRSVPEMAAAFREASTEHFGDNVVGDEVNGLTTSVLGGAIALVRGEGADAAYAYVGRADSKEDLVDELETALLEAGFEEDGELAVPFSAQSVGPILPTLLGILSQSHEIDV